MAHTRSLKNRYKKYNSEQLDELSHMEYNLNGMTFLKHFKKAGGTEHMAKHLWEKFRQHNHSFLGMFGYLDTENKKLVTKALNTIMEERKQDRIKFEEKIEKEKKEKK